MQQKKCALCANELTNETNSAEHIIPNAIGGKKKVRNFICINCNSIKGQSWDVSLVEQFSHLCLLLDITRDRGNVPPQVLECTDGNQYLVGIETIIPAHSTHQVEEAENGMRVLMTARSISELEKRLSGMRRKFPNIDVKDMLEKVQHVAQSIDGQIKYSIRFGDNIAAEKSIVKSTLAMVADAGLSVHSCEHALGWLLNDELPKCYGYCDEQDVIQNRVDGQPFHCVFIQGDEATKRLIGYVELFGLQRVFISLSEKYEGSNCTHLYAIDPTTGKPLNLQINLKEIFARIYDICNTPFKCTPDQIKNLNAIVRRSQQRKTITEAINYAFANCGANEGEFLTEENISTRRHLLTRKIAALIIGEELPADSF